MTEQKIDDADLGEMLCVTLMARDSGFPYVNIEPGVQAEILEELVRFRKEANGKVPTL